MSDGGRRAPMARKEVDRALARLREERERITAGLLDLESNTGYRLLAGARLRGATLRCWEALQGTMTSLWTLLGGYERVLDDAEQVRGRKATPGQREVAELNRLLAAPSVELGAGEVPLERRSLLGPTSEWIDLDEVVKRMIPLYEEAAATISAVEATWSALLSRVAELEEAARAARDLLDSLDVRDAEFDRLRAELDEVGEAVRADPLGFATADPTLDRAADPAAPAGHAGTTRLDLLAGGFSAMRARLAEAVRIRDEHAERMSRVGETIRQVEEAESAARAARDAVLAKIAAPVPPDLPRAAGALRDRLAALDSLGATGRWPELAGRLAELETAARTALGRARSAGAAISGLLDRRDELRGRLDAYKARAGRLGRAEDAELGRLYRHAHDLLWTAPCDLRSATAALAGYQRAIGEAGNG